MFLRAAYNYDADEVSLETGLSMDPDESVTQQQFKEECDINEIVRRFGLTGELPENVRMPVSGDFTGVSDFTTAMQMIQAAEEAFMQFPGDVRARFMNDPAQMIAFLEDGKNLKEAQELGLVPLPPEKTRDMVQAVDELAAKLVPKS
jgi:phage internal scaffolding protein